LGGDFWFSKSDGYYVRAVRGGRFHFVEPLGTCGTKTPCYTTLQAALNAAADGDTVQAAKTLTSEGPVWNKTGTVTISGGWKADFSGQDGTTEIYAPQATGGGGIKVQPNVKVIPRP
ncbi:MAG: family serine peptidase, partial [Thermodesulfobacteriota bacterium]|nr:family serine peptidase [Thermodesulfobacteriota bacterium]